MNDNDIIYKGFLKPDYDTRTFETRLLFIKEIFSNTFNQTDIMGRCILYKLNKSLETYEKQLDKSVDILNEKDPLVILRGLKNID